LKPQAIVVELIDITHIEKQSVTDFYPDLIIAASGYESRAICITEYFTTLHSEKVVLAFKDHARDHARKENDRYFSEGGYKFISCSAKSTPDYKSVFAGFDQLQLNVFVDMSAMPRKWIHSLLVYLHQCNENESIKLRIAYCPAVFTPPLRLHGQIKLKSISLNGVDRFNEDATRKTALLIGLGTEPGLGKNIHQRINPDVTYLFCPEKSIEKQYAEAMLINNHELIESIPIRHFIGYDIADTESIYKLLIDRILPLRGTHRIAIAINGPKIFALIAMVLQLTYPDLELIYPSTRRLKTTDKKPIRNLSAIDLEFNAE